jgi:hypothetical protein
VDLETWWVHLETRWVDLETWWVDLETWWVDLETCCSAALLLCCSDEEWYQLRPGSWCIRPRPLCCSATLLLCCCSAALLLLVCCSAALLLCCSALLLAWWRVDLESWCVDLESWWVDLETWWVDVQTWWVALGLTMSQSQSLSIFLSRSDSRLLLRHTLCYRSLLQSVGAVQILKLGNQHKHDGWVNVSSSILAQGPQAGVMNGESDLSTEQWRLENIRLASYTDAETWASTSHGQ